MTQPGTDSAAERIFATADAIIAELPQQVRLILLRGYDVDITSLRDLVARIPTLHLAAVPQSILDPAASALVHCLEAVSRLAAYVMQEAMSPRPQDDAERARWVGPAVNAIQHANEAFAPVLAYAILDEVRTEADVRDALASQLKRARATAATIDAIRADLEGIVATARETIGRIGASDHAVHFKNQADEHRASSTKWLWATGALAGLVTALAGVNLWHAWQPASGPPPTGVQSAQLILAKVLLFSVVASAVAWCGRVYRAHRHNEVVNRHRQHALSSFETFAQAAQDEQTKATVLIQATTAIFAPQHSGFATTESDPTMPGITELVKVIPGAKS